MHSVIEQKYIHSLKELQADKTEHAYLSLYDHLVGTYNILKDWGNNEEICLCGLFHSIYGNQFFKNRTVQIEKRDQIKQLIGLRAESLVYLFCTLNRKELFTVQNFDDIYLTDIINNKRVFLDYSTYATLVEIEAANLFELARNQKQLPEKEIRRGLILAEIMQPHISTKAFTTLTSFFRDHEASLNEPA